MEGGGKAIIILIFIFVLGVGLYVLRSGVIGKLGSLGSGLFPHMPTSTEPTSTAQKEAPQTQPAGPVEAQPPQSEPSTSSINPSNIPQGYTISQISPYYGKIHLGSVYAPAGFYQGQVSLYANFYDDEAINVSDWKLQARQGSQIVPQAINVYDPSGLTAESDIILRSGDYLNIYTSVTSAIGKNLRLNKCTGYLQNTNHFNPALPMNCPSPVTDRSQISNFTGICQDYLLSFYGCKLPDPNVILPQSDSGCLAFLNNINYKGCYDGHISDSDFLSHEFRAWVGGSFLDSRHDKLELLDRNGLLVDLYQY